MRLLLLWKNPRKKFRLDPDGTLLTDEKTVSKENVNAVQAAYEKR